MADSTAKLPVQGGATLALKVIDNGDSTFSLDVSKSHIRHGALGHYRSAIVVSMATTQAANSRIWQVRNTAANLIIPTRLSLSVMPAGTITTPYRGRFSLFKATGFTAVDTADVVTPTVSRKRTGDMAAVPGGAAIRHVTVAGAAAGMTGGTLTNDGGALAMMQAWLATAAATSFPIEKDLIADPEKEHPIVLAQNEGLSLENSVVGSGTANVVSVLVDFSWAEVAAF